MGGFRRILCAMILLVLCAAHTLSVQAQLPEEIFLQQDRGNSCTLCASTMMIRSLLYLAGSEDYKQVTESDVRSTAWTSVGLSWNWTYEVGEHTVTVGHKHVGGIGGKKLKKLLEDHPEGIVLYCGGSSPHAVFVTDCTDDVVYCADPAATYAGERMPLSDSLLGDRHGSQSSILSDATAYWYIADSKIVIPEPVREVCPPLPQADELENVPARI